MRAASAERAWSRISNDCKSGERAVSWNVEGPRGRRGRTGAEGPEGPPGGSTWVTVGASGDIVASSGNLGSTTVTRESTGVYCILPGDVPHWVMPSDMNRPVTAGGFGGSEGCNGPYSHVTMYDPNTGTKVDNGFVLFLAE